MRILVLFFVVTFAGCGACQSSTQKGGTNNATSNGDPSPTNGSTNGSTANGQTNGMSNGSTNSRNAQTTPTCDGVDCPTDEICDVQGGDAACVCIPGFERGPDGCEPTAVECVTDYNCRQGDCVDGTCVCPDRSIGNGDTCSFLRECSSDPDLCDASAECRQTRDGDACVCPPGTLPDRGRCVPTAFEQLRVGQASTCGIRTDGTMSCWGVGAFELLFDIELAGRPQNRDAGWADLGGAGESDCSVKSDGTLWCGKGRYSDLEDDTAEWVSVESRCTSTNNIYVCSTGGTHCGIDAAGALRCWGRNFSGSLGLGPDVTGTVFEPTLVDDSVWTDVAVGPPHSCGIRADGSLWCWGGVDSQLNWPDSHVPVRVGDASDWESLEPGATCGLRAQGEWWCWADESAPGVPERVGDDRWKSIDVARTVRCGVKTDGTLWCDGRSGYGAHGSDEPILEEFTQVGSDSDWASVTLDALTTCALREDGSAWCFGSHSNGQLGHGPPPSGWQVYPRRVDAPQGWIDVTGGGGFACGIRDDGRLACTGREVPGDDSPGATFEDFGTDRWVDVAAGENHLCAIRDDQTLWCWGGNNLRQSAGGAGSTQVDVQQVGTGTDWAAVFARLDSSCALRTNGDLYCWGDNRAGLLPDESQRVEVPTRVGDRQWQSVALSRFQAIGLRDDGAMWDFRAQARVGTETWKDVASGFSTWCGIRSDDTLWCWGDVPGVPETADSPIQVGSEQWLDIEIHIRSGCGVRRDETLWCWSTDRFFAGAEGIRTYSDLTLVSDVPGWSETRMGVGTNFGLRKSGDIWAWGGNEMGALGTGAPWSSTPLPVAY